MSELIPLKMEFREPPQSVMIPKSFGIDVTLLGTLWDLSYVFLHLDPSLYPLQQTSKCLLPSTVNYFRKLLNLRKGLSCTNLFLHPLGQRCKQQAKTTGTWDG